MQHRFASLLVTALVLLAPAAVRADGGGGGGSMPSPPPTPSTTFPAGQPQSPEEKAAMDQAHAVDLYKEAYREVDKAKAELAEAATMRAAAGTDAKALKKADDKEKSAQKRLEKSRDKFIEVTTLDPKNADGWNMLGFTRRRTGDTKGAFDAYWKCLALKPEHFGAHEYMGEAYLQDNKLTEARAELTWLKKHGAPAAQEATNLDNAITTWVAANPEAASKAVLGANGATATAPGGAMVNGAAAGADSTQK